MTVSVQAFRSQPTRGRPREFDIDEALDRAIPVFCERGFHGASLKDLAAGMKLSEGSIYKAFGDKRNVFLTALERQDAVYGAALRGALSQVKSGKEKLRAALLFYVALSHGRDGMQGCLVITTAVELASVDAEIARCVRDSFRQREVFLANIIRDGQADGSIPKHIDTDGTAWLLLFLFQGLRVVGKTGVTRKELMSTVDAVMKTFD